LKWSSIDVVNEIAPEKSPGLFLFATDGPQVRVRIRIMKLS
jgi:hypothetical protein